jgi:GTP-sensing pleiotropic transcriptional regulator CodY
MNTKKKPVHLSSLETGDSFKVPNTPLSGTLISKGSMGTRVILDGVVTYSSDGKTVLINGNITVIGNRTEVIKYEDINSSKRLETITKIGHQSIDNSGEIGSSNLLV